MIDVRQVRYGSIDCYVIDGGPAPSVATIMCHGYGASGRDLVGLAPEWMQLMGDRASSFRFVFPEAPQTLAELGMPDGHAWWPINMAQLMEHVEAMRFDDLHDAQPPGITDASERICETITAVKGELNGEKTPLALGGFSQGAMLTMNASLGGNIDPPELLFQFSGTTVCMSQWREQLSRLSATKVFQSHGTIDPLLPYASAETLCELLREGNVDVEFHSFHGQHTIDAEAIDISANLLTTLAD